MYWLLDEGRKYKVRADIESLTLALSMLTRKPSQADQLFPFVGRKDLAKARVIASKLSSVGEKVVDPFSGSGIFTYAASLENREVLSNEWDPYTWRMSTAPWRLPDSAALDEAVAELMGLVESKISDLYMTRCNCGSYVVADSYFFDRVPLRYTNVTEHERLGPSGENVTFRGSFRCGFCGATDKFFDDFDLRKLRSIEDRPLSEFGSRVFDSRLIENSRININKNFLIYKSFFPHRSRLAMDYLWQAILELEADTNVEMFLQDAFLSIIPQAKFKDYRSKSQDLHVPDLQLREVNLLSRFNDAVRKRFKRLSEYGLSNHTNQSNQNNLSPIKCEDYRVFLSSIEDASIKLLFTDPPWTDGNAYFEKSQLYYPWLGYNLKDDSDRLSREMVVTNSPLRAKDHDLSRWWADFEEFLSIASSKTVDYGYLAIYFRPIPAGQWLHNLNRLKYAARKSGFEPLLAIDVSSGDPSMRIQQSAAYVFSTDVVFTMLKLPEEAQRLYEGDVDLDYLTFKAGSSLQEELRKPFSRREWNQKLLTLGLAEGLGSLALPKFSSTLDLLFSRYMREVEPGFYLVKPDTPFNGQLFDVPAQERLFAHVPSIVRELTEDDATFTFDEFLLKLSAFVENGTRVLIQSIQNIDVIRLLRPYALPDEDGKVFRKRPSPSLKVSVSKLMDLDPYQFEAFTSQLLSAMGFSQVALMGGSGDRGVDVVASDPYGITTVVQCKRYLQNVGSEPIQRLHSFSVTRGAARRIVITTAGFTKDAADEAVRTKTELIDGLALVKLVDQYMPSFLKGEKSWNSSVSVNLSNNFSGALGSSSSGAGL